MIVRNETEEGKLEDYKRQLEVLFNVTKLNLCEHAGNLHIIHGLPDVYLHIGTQNYFPVNITHKSHTKRSIPANLNKETQKAIETGMRLHGISYSWGFLANMKVEFSNESEMNDTMEIFALTSYEEGLKVAATPRMVEEETQTHPANISILQAFEHIIDQTIRGQRSNMCLTADTTSFITIRHCSRDTSRWIHDVENDLYIEEKTLLCPTRVERNVVLAECETTNASQKWKPSESNKNPALHEAHPKLTLEDVKYAQSEFQENPAEVVYKNQNLTYNWGQLFNRQKGVKYCVTATGLYSVVRVEKCKPTSSGVDISQNFELKADFTIRQYNTNNCLYSNMSVSLLLPCNHESSIWGKNAHSSQLMNGNMKCLENDKGDLILGMCNTKVKSKQWMFQFYNPKVELLYQHMLTSARIIAMHANFSLEDKPFREELPGLLIISKEGEDELIIKPLTTKTLGPESASQVKTRSDTTASTTSTTTTTTTATTTVTPEKGKNGNGKTTKNSAETGTNNGNGKNNGVDVELDVVLDYETVEDAEEKGVTKLTNLTDEAKEYLLSIHEQFKEGLEVKHENQLARESRQIYCELTEVKKNQAILLAQTNGLLAAIAFDLPVCARLKGLGQTIMVQQCGVKRANITAIETECGYQPYFSYNDMNYTIGTDGWSIHPFTDCFWKGHYVNLNGKTFSWEKQNSNWEWIEQESTIHYSHLNLVSEFKEIPLNDYNYEIRAHPAHNLNDLENINVLNELIGRIEDSNSNSLSDLVASREQNTNIGNVFSWTEKVKIMIICITCFIILAIVVRVFFAINPIPKIMHRIRIIKEKRLSKKDKRNLNK